MLAYFVSILEQCGTVFTGNISPSADSSNNGRYGNGVTPTQYRSAQYRLSNLPCYVVHDWQFRFGGNGSRPHDIRSKLTAFVIYSSETSSSPTPFSVPDTSSKKASTRVAVAAGVFSVTAARHVCKQILQLLHILFENISQDTSLYFLLSNNFINQIIECPFDFTDDEVQKNLRAMFYVDVMNMHTPSYCRFLRTTFLSSKFFPESWILTLYTSSVKKKSREKTMQLLIPSQSFRCFPERYPFLLFLKLW